MIGRRCRKAAPLLWACAEGGDAALDTSMDTMMKHCMLCPRECGADRTAGAFGVCRAPDRVILARAALHFWEEPCISGQAGSGAVFFSGCSLGCVFCQNAEISGSYRLSASGLPEREAVRPEGRQAQAGSEGRQEQVSFQGNQEQAAFQGNQEQASFQGNQEQASFQGRQAQAGFAKKPAQARPEGKLPGIEVSEEELAGIFLRLQNREGANNINLVTATHYIPQTAHALSIAREKGLRIPVIYNSGGYEKESSLRMLEGLVDVYLPDFKYMSSETAAAYSHAPDYPETAKLAIAEMIRQTGAVSFCSGDGTQLIQKGVIVRHLLLPGHVNEAKEIISWLHSTYGNAICLSIMNQYTPMPRVREHPLLGRKTTRREYERLLDYAVGIGVEHGYMQEGGTAKASFIPSWNGEGVR